MYKRIIKVLLLSLLVLGVTTSVYAQPILNPANGHYYERIDFDGYPTWYEARDYAASLSYMGMQGHLVTITSAEEQAFIETNFTLPSYTWIGGYQDTQPPAQTNPAIGWQWLTGESWSYTNWIDGQPSDGGEDYLEDNQQNCLEMYPNYYGSDAYTWNDYQCDGDEEPHALVEYEESINCFMNVGDICYVYCILGTCPASHCNVYVPGLSGTLNVGQITYMGCEGTCPPNSCIVYVPSLVD